MLNVLLLIALVCGISLYWYQERIKFALTYRKIAITPFSRKELAYLLQHMPVYARLSEGEQTQLLRHCRFFLHQKRIIGMEGLTLSQPQQLLVAANAALLVLNHAWPIYPNVREVLVYPSAYYAKERHFDGVLESYHDVVRQGESWPGGTLVLSWQDVLKGAQDDTDGHNLVIHEFAHQLDQQTGTINGTPPLGSKSQYQSWQAACQHAFNKLKNDKEQGLFNVIDYYGATNEAEFFACVSEAYFERPHALYRQDSHLYGELLGYYGTDPRMFSQKPRTYA